MEKSIKNNPNIAMIILSKNKNNLIKDLLESIKLKCFYPKDKLTLYIADTGSDDSVLKGLETIVEEFNTYFKTVLLKYDFYNFAKINNDVVFNHIDKKIDTILFSNNDIRLKNDAITIMSSLIDENTGTVGTRLLYENETVQHCGVIFLKQEGRYGFVHAFHGVKNEDLKNLQPVLTFPLGSTGAFLMVDRTKFEKVGGFNEKYKVCFEDVELNLRLWLKGYVNKTSVDSICYHLESATRGPQVNQDDVKKIISYLISLPEVNDRMNKQNGFLI